MEGLTNLSGLPARLALDLSAHRNGVGTAAPGHDPGPGLDGFGRAFPAEELAPLAELLGGLPDDWGRGAADHVECLGQQLALERPLRVRSVGVLGACTGGSYREELLLEHPTGRVATLPLAVGLTDFLAAAPGHGERCAAACSVLREHGRDVLGPRPRLWQAEVRLAEPRPVSAVRLPVNPEVHVFALWVLAEESERTGPDGEAVA